MKQSAKHDAAAKAWRVLQNEPPPENLEVNGRESEEENLKNLKSFKYLILHLNVTCEWIFRFPGRVAHPTWTALWPGCQFGEFIVEGEGKSKNIPKENAG